MAAEVERNLLNHYRLTTLYPTAWPTRDDSDSEDEDELGRSTSRNSLARFPGLDKHGSVRSRMSSSKENGGGSGNLVQKDEPDPLGIAPSVVSELRRRGLDVEDNLKLRNQFMLSSTTFSSTLFLSQVHQNASTESLLQGLDFLSRSIEKKSASLKVLVESNFERFVKAKATIDNVYLEMRTQGGEHQQQQQQPRKPHSRHTSRGTSHFRHTSGPFSSAGTLKPPIIDKKKNALTKESEYGVQGIKAPLIELAVKAEEVWGPALGGRDREDELRSVLGFVEGNRPLLRLSGGIKESIRKRDFDSLVEQYHQARKAAEEAKAIADAAMQHNATLSDYDIQQIIVTAKIWYDVEQQIEAFKKTALKQLLASHPKTNATSSDDKREAHMDYIAVLLQLGSDENPIWLWLSNWYEQVKQRIRTTFERTRADIEIARRRLGNCEKPSPQVAKLHLQSAAAASATEKKADKDSARIMQFWDLVETSLSNLLAHRGGLLGEVIEYWDNARSFIDGKAQKSFPASVWSSDHSRQHLKLPRQHVEAIYNDVADLVRLIRESVFSFFTDPPIEDISEIYSAIPQTPATASTPTMPIPNQSQRSRSFALDMADIPPPSPQRGEVWEKFAFWPPHANSLSGVQYLSKILILVGTAASEINAMSAIKGNHRIKEQLRTLVGAVRERCVQAVCAAWNSDAENGKLLEDWSRSPERKDLTNMPARFMAFEEAVLTNMQRILYVTEAMSSPMSPEVVVPPSAKLLQMVRSQFVTSLYKALSGTVENAERSQTTAAIAGSSAVETGNNNAGRLDVVDRNIRMLLTLSNLHHLRKEVIPQLIAQFETSFSVKLTDESKTIRDVLGQIDARLFQSYVKPSVDRLSRLIEAGVSPSSWLPTTSRPTNAKPYVYEVLLALVLVHTEVSTSATALTNHILSYLLEQVSAALLSAFKARQTYALPALMQATLDVELIAQTLSNYTTEKASDVQSQIYLVLDERTDQEARARLQSELPEMRATLKRLREGTKGQFGCFRRERRGRSDRPAAAAAAASSGGRE